MRRVETHDELKVGDPPTTEKAPIRDETDYEACDLCAGTCATPNTLDDEPPDEIPQPRKCNHTFCMECYVEAERIRKDPRPATRPCPRCWGYGKFPLPPLHVRLNQREELAAFDEREFKRKRRFYLFEDHEEKA